MRESVLCWKLSQINPIISIELIIKPKFDMTYTTGSEINVNISLFFIKLCPNMVHNQFSCIEFSISECRKCSIPSLFNFVLSLSSCFQKFNGICLYLSHIDHVSKSLHFQLGRHSLWYKRILGTDNNNISSNSSLHHIWKKHSAHWIPNWGTIKLAESMLPPPDHHSDFHKTKSLPNLISRPWTKTSIP